MIHCHAVQNSSIVLQYIEEKIRSESHTFCNPENQRPKVFHYKDDKLVIGLQEIDKDGWTILPHDIENHVSLS